MDLIREYKSNGESMNVYVEEGKLNLEFDISKMKKLIAEEKNNLIELLEEYIIGTGYTLEYLLHMEVIGLNIIKDREGNILSVLEEEDEKILKLEDNNESEYIILEEIDILKLYSLLI